MPSTGNTSGLSKRALANLIRRRHEIKGAIEAASTDPASYSIQGSVAATARTLQELEEELARIDRQIQSLLVPNSGGIRRVLPRWEQA
jgi:hypothetical protein